MLCFNSSFVILYTMKRRCIDWQVILAKQYWCNMSENVWAEMYISWYEIIVDCKAEAVTQGDRQFDGGVGGGVSCYVSIQVLLFCIQWQRHALIDK